MDFLKASFSISVIMPVYNGLRYVQEAVDGVLAQSFTGWELILVDDGSTDGSAELLDRLAAGDARLRVIRQENAGQSAARNAGAAAATGKYLAFLDQDDYWRPRHLEQLAAYLDAHPEVGLAYDDVDVIDTAGRSLGLRALSGGLFPFVKKTHPKLSIVDCLKEDMSILPGACLVRAEAFHKAGGFDPELCGYEDDDLFLRIFWHWPMAFVREPGLVYRLHEASASRTVRFTHSRVRFYQKLKEWYPDDPGIRAFYQRELLVPRFCRSTIGTGEIARRKKDRQAVRAVYEAYKEFSPKPLFYRLFTPLLHPLFPDTLYFAAEAVRKFLKDCLSAVFAK